MLKILPIMLFSNAPDFIPYYAQNVPSYMPIIMLHHAYSIKTTKKNQELYLN